MARAMEWWPWLVGLAAIALIEAIVIRRLRRRIAKLDHQHRSQAVRHGKTVEHMAPFTQDWPWDPRGFRFIGDPVDGIQFTEDGVVIVEIKTGHGRLNTAQRRIRDQVLAGRVQWTEVRL